MVSKRRTYPVNLINYVVIDEELGWMPSAFKYRSSAFEHSRFGRQTSSDFASRISKFMKDKIGL